MPPSVVVEVDPGREAGLQLHEVLVLAEVHVLVLQAPPEALNHHVVDPAPLAVHAHANAVGLRELDPCLARELAALIGVQDLGPRARGLFGRQVAAWIAYPPRSTPAAPGCRWRRPSAGSPPGLPTTSEPFATRAPVLRGRRASPRRGRVEAVATQAHWAPGQPLPASEWRATVGDRPSCAPSLIPQTGLSRNSGGRRRQVAPRSRSHLPTAHANR